MWLFALDGGQAKLKPVIGNVDCSDDDDVGLLAVPLPIKDLWIFRIARVIS